ncbi:conserved membrane hypothetical protein [Cupriavidus taiwanensis]|uniref:DUF202 domain-containing protein n=1 Tax=Cupriavidus taiwanensis TaxID=164546 RepID=A0A375CR42_9BURK|nr:DUF202 domain-containing protein [Cupriavidus taiwanensis]SOY77690.1 conserved membrane hypothetical protein [Cupriavidus taiwanensis]
MRRAQWLKEGANPDYRFSLANERTFLAWIRTALALSAGGLVLQQFAANFGAPRAMNYLAFAFGAGAPMICVFAYAHWKSCEIAMRHGRSLPVGVGASALAGAVGIVGLGSLVLGWIQ